MLLTILIVVIMLGLVMPLFWIVGTLGSIAYVGLNGMGVARKETNRRPESPTGIHHGRWR